MPTFGSVEALRRYAAGVGLRVSEMYPGLYDLDQIARWLTAPSAATIACQPFLYGRQLVENAATSVGAPLHSGPLNLLVYQHLWVGIYAPPETVPDRLPIDVAYLTEHLRWGLELFRTRTRRADGPPRRTCIPYRGSAWRRGPLLSATWG